MRSLLISVIFLIFSFLILKVTWDEPDLLQNVKKVSPWLVELVSNMPTIHPSSFPPPLKKMRLPHQHPDFPFEGQIPVPTFPSNHHHILGPSYPFHCLPESSPAGMQGARHHPHYGLSSLSDHLHLSKLQSSLFPTGFPPLDHTHSASTLRIPNNNNNPTILKKPSMSENVSCVLSIAASADDSSKKQDDIKTPHLVLFGRTILSEQQISLTCSADTISPVLTENSSSNANNANKLTNFSDGSGSALQSKRSSSDKLQWHKEVDANLETGHCKVFMESEDVGRTLDLSLLRSYDELYKKLEDLFGIEKSELVSRVLYRDITGAVKHIGDEPFR